MSKRIMISNIGLISSIGIGFDNFAKKILKDSENSLPGGLIEDFDIVEFVDKKGTASLDRTSALSIAACSLIPNLRKEDDSDLSKFRTGIVLGNSGGSLESISRFISETYTNHPPYMVSALEVPNLVMNVTAAQCAIWNNLCGINSTVCTGQVSGLSAIQYASRMLNLNHADKVIAGSVSEYCDYHLNEQKALHDKDDFTIPLGEGAAVFELSVMQERENALGEILSVHTVTCPKFEDAPDVFEQSFQACISQTLNKAKVQFNDIAYWAGSLSASKAINQCEIKVIEQLNAKQSSQELKKLVMPNFLGRTLSASASFQIAGLLAQTNPGIGLVTSLDAAGQIGCMLVAIYPQ